MTSGAGILSATLVTVVVGAVAAVEDCFGSTTTTVDIGWFGCCSSILLRLVLPMDDTEEDSSLRWLPWFGSSSLSSSSSSSSEDDNTDDLWGGDCGGECVVTSVGG